MGCGVVLLLLLLFLAETGFLFQLFLSFQFGKILLHELVIFDAAPAVVFLLRLLLVSAVVVVT